MGPAACHRNRARADPRSGLRRRGVNLRRESGTSGSNDCFSVQACEAEGAAVVDVVVPPPLGWVLAVVEVLRVDVDDVELGVVFFFDVFPPLTGGAVVVVVDGDVAFGTVVPSTCWAWVIACAIMLRSVWNCERLSALSAASALV
jgi:hypothetical protein